MRELPEGQGSYGCIVSYEKYKCPEDPINPSEPMISKIMTSQGAFNVEMYIADLLKPIDPEQHYLIYAKNGCVIKRPDEDKDVLPCEGDYFHPLARQIYVITMKSAGISVEGFVDGLGDNKIPLPTTLRLINDILHGLSLLHRNGITHGDISPKNITIASIPISNVMKRAYIIDFGLSFDEDYDSTSATMFEDIENAFEVFRILLYKTEATDEERYYYKHYFETPKNITSLPPLDEIKTMFEPPRILGDTPVKRTLFD